MRTHRLIASMCLLTFCASVTVAQEHYRFNCKDYE